MSASVTELLFWSLQPEHAAGTLRRELPGSDVASTTIRLQRLEYLHHQAAELGGELAEYLSDSQINALSLALSRAVRDAQRALLIEEEIESRRTADWRKARPSDGPSIDDFRLLVPCPPAISRLSLGRREARPGGSPARSSGADEGDDGPGEPARGAV